MRLTFDRSRCLLENLHCQFWRHPVAVPAPASDVKHVWGSTFLAGTMARCSYKMPKDPCILTDINRIDRKNPVEFIPDAEPPGWQRRGRERVQLHQVTPPQSVLYRASPSHGAVLELQRKTGKTAGEGEIMHRQHLPFFSAIQCAIKSIKHPFLLCEFG